MHSLPPALARRNACPSPCTTPVFPAPSPWKPFRDRLTLCLDFARGPNRHAIAPLNRSLNPRAQHPHRVTYPPLARLLVRFAASHRIASHRNTSQQGSPNSPYPYIGHPSPHPPHSLTSPHPRASPRIMRPHGTKQKKNAHSTSNRSHTLITNARARARSFVPVAAPQNKLSHSYGTYKQQQQHPPTCARVAAHTRNCDG
ncbi:hypothetical protein EJ04DRAFT_527318 [Polyplosphaeria fusca]|uniref:Uncharacterized protein n=1 Tax=Polyplosphaeria fusca TaxID=682080 RepID=A0A9P4QRD2_9PLEO|nr:hypothetical protein EJ04DRAFT_527318 [Polyplosphaeria fusca]